MTGLLSAILAFLGAVGSGIVLRRLMSKRPRWMALLGFAIMVAGIISGVTLGFPSRPIGLGLFVFGTICALTAWTVAAPRLTSVILWSMVSAMLVTSALLVLLPGDFVATGIGLALAVSFIWVGFQFWCYWDKHGWRVASGLIAISVISGIIAFTVPPSI
ncbi:MAG: hypothetical protein AAGB04_27765 [Pseudomonadota bacterium]